VTFHIDNIILATQLADAEAANCRLQNSAKQQPIITNAGAPVDYQKALAAGWHSDKLHTVGTPICCFR